MTKARSLTFLLIALTSMTLSFGCAKKKCGCAHAVKKPAQKAWIEIAPLGESKVSGKLVLWQTKEGVRFHGSIAGLSPNAKHGFHVHEKGDCSAKDGSSAGGHFAPHHKHHGDLHDADSHTGDLGNLKTDAKGMAYVDFVKKGATVGDGQMSFLGKAIIVHAKTDDLKTQPTGASGARIGCGVIQKKTKKSCGY